MFEVVLYLAAEDGLRDLLQQGDGALPPGRVERAAEGTRPAVVAGVKQFQAEMHQFTVVGLLHGLANGVPRAQSESACGEELVGAVDQVAVCADRECRRQQFARQRGCRMSGRAGWRQRVAAGHPAGGMLDQPRQPRIDQVILPGKLVKGLQGIDPGPRHARFTVGLRGPGEQHVGCAAQQATKALQLQLIMVRPDGQAEVEADRVIEKRRGRRQCRQVFPVAGTDHQPAEAAKLCLLLVQQLHGAVRRGRTEVMALERRAQPGAELQPAHGHVALAGCLVQQLPFLLDTPAGGVRLEGAPHAEFLETQAQPLQQQDRCGSGRTGELAQRVGRLVEAIEQLLHGIGGGVRPAVGQALPAQLDVPAVAGKTTADILVQHHVLFETEHRVAQVIALLTGKDKR